jgi:hypothetical protein
MSNVRRGRAYREKRQDEAKGRQEAWDGLTREQKIESLDKRLGVGVGAKKQRERLS